MAARQSLFFGLVDLLLGIIIYAGFTLYVPDYLDAMNVECEDAGPFTCGGLIEMVKNVSIIISVVGLAQILYWVFFEREREVNISVRGSANTPVDFKVCPECNTINDATAKFCKNCGSELSKNRK